MKNGLPALTCRVMKSLAAAMNSSSTVSMRLRVERAGVLDLPIRRARAARRAAPNFLRNFGSFGDKCSLSGSSSAFR